MRTAEEIRARVGALAGEATELASNQHVVSRVVLKEFSEPCGQRDARQVCSLNLEYAQSKPSPRGLEHCGAAPVLDFIAYASNSLEQRWQEVENSLADVLKAIRGRTIFSNPALVRLVYDAIALHSARSIQTAIAQWRAFTATYNQQRSELRSTLLSAQTAYQLSSGVYTSGEYAREATLDEIYAESVENEQNGALYRVMMEVRYERTRDWLRSMPIHDLDILTPAQGEFLIGDIPAVTVKYGQEGAGFLNGLGVFDADAIILPLGPHHLAQIDMQSSGNFVEVPEHMISWLNRQQVLAAYQYVYIRPGSGCEEMVPLVNRPKPSEGPLQDAYARYEELKAQQKGKAVKQAKPS